MLYLLGPGSGGTAFYRHRRTGFELIGNDRRDAFEDAVKQDELEFGPPPERYFYGDDERYEMIGEIEARPDRLALYPGRALHSGVIPPNCNLSPSPEDGRLTINLFIQGG